MTYIKNAKVVLEKDILEDGAILIGDGRILAVGEADELPPPADACIVDAAEAFVGPGFVDIHNHGGGGKMFFDDPETAAAHFLSHGQTTTLPTLYCTLDKNALLIAISRIQRLMAAGGVGDAIGGIYMEGPYLNPKYGASAAFNQWTGEITENAFREIVDAAEHDVRVWVISPEREGIERFMAYAKSVHPDVCFSVGHSEATPAEIDRVKHYGVRLFTHCLNATASLSRFAGTRGCGPDEACFLDDDAYAELICDSLGAHVCADWQRLLIKIKGIDKLVLITDSFVTDFAPQEHMRNIPDLTFDENGNLCGSKLTMDVACRNFMKHTGANMREAFLVAARNPARVIGLDAEIGTVAPGKRANLVFVDENFTVQRVMLNGKFVNY